MELTKTITPAFEIKGKRKKLTGFIGELRDGKTLIHSQEYSTNSQAEQALDALAFELLTDLAEQGLIDELPTFEPSTCVYYHKPHHPQSCPEMRGRLFAPRCVTCGDDGDCPDCDPISAPVILQRDLIYPPLDLDFVSVGWSE